MKKINELIISVNKYRKQYIKKGFATEEELLDQSNSILIAESSLSTMKNLVSKSEAGFKVYLVGLSKSNSRAHINKKLANYIFKRIRQTKAYKQKMIKDEYVKKLKNKKQKELK